MNRLLKGLVLFLVALLLVFSFCACKQETETEHTEHIWDSPVVTKKPTCTEKGSQTLTCSVCGATKSEDIPATGHTYSEAWEHDETYHWHLSSCEHEGLKGSFEPHEWKNPVVTKESSCTEEGSVTYTCKCGAEKTEAIPCHAFATTWTSDDTYHWHAATCEHAEEVSGKEEHTWGSYKNNGNGTATYTCNVCGKQVTKTLPTVISMVNAGPGEDASKGIVISWHSTTTGSYLEYTDANGDEFVNTVANGQCNEALTTAKWEEGDSANHYRCKVYLDNLTPDSTYKYRIRHGGTCSEVATFRTAEADTTYFQFMWLSDNHVPKGGETTLERVRALINYAQAKNGVDLDFVLFTGDMVNKGKIYGHWKYWSDSGLMNDITYAFVVGNHDYYDTSSDKNRESNAFFNDVCAFPANYTEGTASVLDSNYWFIWNRVLFVCIDSMTQEGVETGSLAGAKLSDQQAWFKAVVAANEGKYDYLIFAQHYPWFDTDTKACEYGNYSSWYKIFDQYKVDFALSSDEHTYRRTYALYNNKNPNYVSEKNPNAEKAEMINGKVSKGTVYVVSNQTQGDSISSLKNEAAKGLKYVEYTAGGVGGVYFTVTPTEMTLHLIGTGGKEYDTITVLKKDR